MLPEGPLIGRERELLALELALGVERFVTVTGAGGCGKTRVARELAARIGQRHRAVPAVVVGLATIRRNDRLVDALVRGLGVRERAGRAQSEVLLDWMMAHPIVLVIDNCEHVASELARLVTWLADGAPQLRVLATTREPLGIPDEHVFALAPLGLPDIGGDVAAVVRSDAGRFFVDRAAAVDPSFALTPSTARAVVRICHELDGLPLALKLAAPVAGRDRGGPGSPWPPRRGRRRCCPAPASLGQGLVAVDYGLLDDTERRLLRSLPVFCGGWDAAAARAVALPDDDETHVIALLAGLERKGLIVALPGRGEARWSLLQTVAGYAAERLVEDAEEEAVRARHLAWYRAFAAGIDGLLLASDGRALIERETPNLRVALDRAATTDIDAAFEMVGSLLRHWILAEHFEEGRAAVAVVLASDA